VAQSLAGLDASTAQGMVKPAVRGEAMIDTRYMIALPER
jgi:hypothetical protein